MPALTFKGVCSNLSYAHDTLTFYPTFAYYEGDEEHKLRNCLDVIEECGKLDFVIKRLPDQQPTSENEKFISALEHIKDKDGSNLPQNLYHKFVRRTDDDHMLYHQEDENDKEEFGLEKSHWHIKFRTVLTRDQLAAILDVFIEKNLLCCDERNGFLNSFDERHIQNRKALQNRLCDNPEAKHPETIIKFIAACKDNDMLFDLHNYLAGQEFDYLRVKEQQTEVQQKKYLTVIPDGQTVATSRAWAKIETAIKLQISRNIQTQCTKFTPDLGKQCAKRLHKQYRFFGVSQKQKENPETDKNGIYLALVEGNSEKLDKKANKMFGGL